jgi:acyl dehydratase
MYFDDLPVGYSFETESRTLSEDDILAFARQWDPQYFHTDP